MTFICLISGCTWTDAHLVHLGNQDLLCQSCSRCGSTRITSAKRIGGMGQEPLSSPLARPAGETFRRRGESLFNTRW
jgi:hypothetical protein